MGDFGIKIAQTGKGITTTDIRELIMSSQFSMLKFHSDTTGSITLNPGDYSKYYEFSHDLGYVPSYIAYYQWAGRTYNINAGAAQGVGGILYSYSWASTTKVRVGIAFVGSPYSGGTYHLTMQDCYDENSGSRIGYRVGKDGGTRLNGALWFPRVTVPKNATIISASLNFFTAARWGSNQDIQCDTWGIDEDNTADFGSYPMNRPQTTASSYLKANIDNSRMNVDVANIVREITTRSGWSSGNNMGFQVRARNESPDNVGWEDDIGHTTDSYLDISYVYGSPITVPFRCVIFKDKIA